MNGKEEPCFFGFSLGPNLTPPPAQRRRARQRNIHQPRVDLCTNEQHPFAHARSCNLHSLALTTISRQLLNLLKASEENESFVHRPDSNTAKVKRAAGIVGLEGNCATLRIELPARASRRRLDVFRLQVIDHFLTVDLYGDAFAADRD